LLGFVRGDGYDLRAEAEYTADFDLDGLNLIDQLTLELPPAAIATLLNCTGNAYKPRNEEPQSMQSISKARLLSTLHGDRRL